MAVDDLVETYRPLLFALAYRMLGSATDAEDIVQETFIRYTASIKRDGAEAVRSPKALLTAIATRLCLDQLKIALVTLVDGRLTYVTTFEVVDGRIQTMRAVANPEKLAYLAGQLRARPVTV